MMPDSTRAASSSKRCCNLLSSLEALPRPARLPPLPELILFTTCRAGSWETHHSELVMAGDLHRVPSALILEHAAIGSTLPSFPARLVAWASVRRSRSLSSPSSTPGRDPIQDCDPP